MRRSIRKIYLREKCSLYLIGILSLWWKIGVKSLDRNYVMNLEFLHDMNVRPILIIQNFVIIAKTRTRPRTRETAAGLGPAVKWMDTLCGAQYRLPLHCFFFTAPLCFLADRVGEFRATDTPLDCFHLTSL